MTRLLDFVKAFALVAVLGASGWGVSACNTVEGVGEDISAGGRAISRTSRDVRD